MDPDFLSELTASLDESRYPGELTAGCELMECLAHSQESETLLARDRGSGELYVVKCYAAGHPLFEASEPEPLRRLAHPGLPRFVAEYRNPQLRCVLREYVEGRTVAQRAREAVLSQEETRHIGLQLCDILSYLHSQEPPVIHRDIKPQNVVVDDAGRVFLIDFGAARLYTGADDNDDVIFGTRTFAPPEQYGFAPTDCRSDIFSLGVLLQWLLSGATAAALPARTPLQKVISRCTAFDPQNRYADAAAVKKDLLAGEPSRRRKRRLLVVAAAVAVLAVALWATSWWRDYQPLNEPGHRPAFITEQGLKDEAAAYLNQRFATQLFEAGDAAADIGYIRTLLVEVFGYAADYAYALPAATPPMEVEESFLPWAFGDEESLDRNKTVYMIVKIFWPQVVGDWSSLKNDTGEYPGVRVALPFAEKKGVTAGVNRPDNLTRGDVAVLFANAARAYGEQLPPQLAAGQAAGQAAAAENNEDELSASGFREPLLEQAVRLALGRDDAAVLGEDELAAVVCLYVAADQAYATAEEFYAAVNQWYAAGRQPWGQIRSLEDLSRLPNLRELCLVAQQIDDLTPLGGLKRLEKVEFKHNNISDLSPLAGLEQLVSAGLNDNPLSDLSPLATYPNLRFIDLCDVSGYDPAFLDALGDLDFLDISNPTDSYKHLAGKSIRELKLSNSPLDDLSWLDEVSGLEKLELNNTAVSDLTPLAQHQSLSYLRLSHLAIDDLSVLLKLPNLQQVTLSREMQTMAEAIADKADFSIEYEN